MSIEKNIAQIRRNIYNAAIAASRNPEDILLCAATKMNDTNAVKRAIQAGVDCCGENRVQELTTKLQENAYTGAPVHFIGHLQTNKVRMVVGKVDLIQSVDSGHLLDAINKEAEKQNIIQDIHLEINIANESSKSGFLPSKIMDILPLIPNFKNVFVKGLMAIPPICRKKGDNCKFFQEMYHLSVDIMQKKYDNICVDILSMGMSDDYEDAIACGSTMVRVGTAIFGARDYGNSHQ